jgi:hypothetical protein
MNQVAEILKRDFSSIDKAIAYAERIARNAARNSQHIMAREYEEAAESLKASNCACLKLSPNVSGTTGTGVTPEGDASKPLQEIAA